MKWCLRFYVQEVDGTDNRTKELVTEVDSVGGMLISTWLDKLMSSLILKASRPTVSLLANNLMSYDRSITLHTYVVRHCKFLFHATNSHL